MAEKPQTARLEAFSDGVLAVIITIMVLELKAPAGDTLASLRSLVPHFLIYILSFQTVGTYWNNHHHLLRVTRRIDASVMWANLGLLFWLSLIPFFTSWLGEHGKAPIPTASFGAVLFLSAGAYGLLTRAILGANKDDADLRQHIGGDLKGKISLIAYFVSIPVGCIAPLIADMIFVIMAIMWLVPDKRLVVPVA